MDRTGRMGEARDTNSVVIASVSGWNVLAARRIGNFTPLSVRDAISSKRRNRL